MATSRPENSYALQDPEPLVVVAPNRLRTSRGYDEFELVLEGDARDRSQIRIKYRDGRKERWNPVEFVKLDAEQLPNYQGEYGCTDLESVYRISAIDGKLFIQLNYGRKRRLLPTVPDTFKTVNERFSGMVFTFSRDESENITGFGVEFDRIKDLRFEKRSP